jgi:hypothetical protein
MGSDAGAHRHMVVASKRWFSLVSLSRNPFVDHDHMEEATFVKSHVAALSALPTTYSNTFEPAPEDFPRKLPVIPVSTTHIVCYLAWIHASILD